MDNVKHYELITVCDRHMDVTPIGEVIDKHELNGISYSPKVGMYYDVKQGKKVEADEAHWIFDMHSTEARELEDAIAGIAGVKRFLLLRRVA